MASSDLNSLRAQVRRAHRNATSKVSRLRNKGVEIGSTALDPRRDLSNVKRYTRQQMESQLNRLNAFNSRANAPVAGQDGVILPSADVRRYRQVERKYNRIANREYAKVRDLPALGRGMTVGEADQVDRPTRRTRGAGQAVARPYEPIRRDLSKVTGRDALRQLTEQLERRTRRDWKPSRLRDQRKEFMDMLTATGNISAYRDAQGLTDEQFNILFNYNTSVVEQISMSYELVKLRWQGTAEEFQERIDESASVRIANAIKWARTV